MKTVVCTKYGSPDVIQLREAKIPAPGDNEVLVKIHSSVVTQADCTFRKGVPFITRFFTGITRPKYTPGDVLAGEIEATGKDVKRFIEGDRVFGSAGPGFGAHAEYICLSENEALAAIPDRLTFDEAAAVYDGILTALPFIRDKANIQSGQKVLINGASGGVGTAAVQIAKYFGAEVTGVCSTANIELVKSLGADRVIDYAKEDFTKNGWKYDIIFDTVGKSSFTRCKDSLNQKGIYLSTVLKPGIIFQMLVTSIARSKRAVITFAGLRKSSEKNKDLIFLKELIEADKIKPVIDRRYPIERIAEAHCYVDKGHKKGNVVITVKNN